MYIKIFENFTKLLGYEPSYIEKINDEKQKKWLLNCNALAFSSLILLSFSSSLMAWITVNDLFWKLIVSIAIFLLTLYVFGTIHRLFIKIEGFPIGKNINLIKTWRPSPLRLILFFIVGIALAQPFFLVISGDGLKQQASKNVTENTISQFQGAQSNRIITKTNELMINKSLLEDELQRISPEILFQNKNLEKIKTRKAFLVGASKYIGVIKPLKNTKNDIENLQNKLEVMGYLVTVSMDDPLIEIKKKLQIYISSLQPNDISIIYFSGHGIQQYGINYFIPIDYASGVEVESRVDRGVKQLRERALMLNSLIDNFTRTPIRLNLLLLDACRNGFDNETDGMASMQNTTSKNVMVVMAASPGQTALDNYQISGQKSINSPFTSSLIKNLDRDEDVGKIMRRVRADTVELTEDIKRQRNEPPQTPWVSESFSDLEIKLVPPFMQKREAEKSIQVIKKIAPNCYKDGSNIIEPDSLCLLKNLQNTKRQIDYLQLRGSSNSFNNTNWIKTTSEDVDYVGERLRIMWHSYYLIGFATLIYALFVISGILLRDFYKPESIRSYEAFRNKTIRSFLKNTHFSYQASINALFSKQRKADDLPLHSHWSTEQDFYSSYYQIAALNEAPDIRYDSVEMQRMWTWLSTVAVTEEATT